MKALSGRFFAMLLPSTFGVPLPLTFDRPTLVPAMVTGVACGLGEVLVGSGVMAAELCGEVAADEADDC